MTSTPKRFSSVIDRWGVDTKDPRSDGRKIAVSKFDPGKTIKDLLEYFGTETRVEGMTLFRKGFAIVQFKRPKDYTYALSFNDCRFDRDFIKVEPYRSGKPPPPPHRKNPPSPLSGSVDCKKRSRSRSGGRSRSRSPSTNKSPGRKKSPTTKSPRRGEEYRRNGAPIHHVDREKERETCDDRELSVTRPRSTSPRRRDSQARNRSPARGPDEVRDDRSLVPRGAGEMSDSINRGRSRSRSRKQSPPNRTDYRNEPVNLNLPEQGPENMVGLLMSYHLESRARSMQTTFGGSSQSRTTFQSTLAASQPHAITMEPHEKDLPSEIELILKLVIEQGTAKKLSLANIHDVLNYFESARLFALELSRQIPPADVPIQPQQAPQQIFSGNNVQHNQVTISNQLPPKASSSNHSQSQSDSYSKNTESSNTTSINNTTKPLLEKLAELNRYNNKKY